MATRTIELTEREGLIDDSGLYAEEPLRCNSHVISPLHEHAQSIEEVVPADSEQGKWLLTFLADANVVTLYQLRPDKLDDFAQALGEVYHGLKMRGVNQKSKENRMSILASFLRGDSYKEIAKATGRPKAWVKKSLDDVASAIAERVPQEKLEDTILHPEAYITGIKYSPITKITKQKTSEKQPDTDESTAKKIGYYSIVLLAELELGERDISTQEDNFHLREDTSISSRKVLNNSIRRLADEKLINHSKNDDVETLALTIKGERIVAYIKKHFESLGIEPPAEKLVKNTSYKVLDLIAEHTNYDPGKNFVMENDVSIFPYLSNLLGVSEDAITRRLYSLSKEKEYVTTVKGIFEGSDGSRTYDDADKDGREIIKGVAITEAGLDYLRRVREKYADTDLLDENIVWEVEQAVDTCLELAEALGRNDVCEDIQQSRDGKHYFEMSEIEFRAEQRKVFKLLRKLREEYVQNRAAA